MNRLFTKGAKNGDIVWSLLAARRWSRDCGEPVDFACMSVCEPLLDLIRQQPYIRKAFAVPSWVGGCVPDVNGYDDVRNGSYHRMPDKQLAHFIAETIQVQLKEEDQTPWIEFKDFYPPQSYVAYAWNHLHAERKALFIKELSEAMPETRFINCNEVPWGQVAQFIAKAKAFVGCRSCNFVIANGVGQKNIITFEPEEGRLNPIFGCPWGPEKNVPFWQNAYEIIKAITP